MQINKYRGFFFLIHSYFIILCFLSCSTGKPSTNNKENQAYKNQPVKNKISVINKPEPNSSFMLGDLITISVNCMDSSIIIDSVQFFVNGVLLGTSSGLESFLVWNSSGSKVGKRNIKTITYSKNKSGEVNNISITMLSDLIPLQYGYKIIQVFPHDPEAYTQGLVFEQGILYEGTGQYGKSSLRKTDIETGKLLNNKKLPPDLFGEGVCIFKEKIIQLTWKSRIGFVYNKSNFEFINRIKYQTQGWGITTDGKRLIMSDGSNIIYFLEPEYFSELSRIEVYDNNGPVNDLNELEFINGEIYANVYQTDKIVIIDMYTGKVLAWINLEGLISEEDYADDIDVLNGIAYDKEKNRLFVTGKMWPKLFEIELVLIK
jgi:glutamine cyclotransferase